MDATRAIPHVVQRRVVSSTFLLLRNTALVDLYPSASARRVVFAVATRLNNRVMLSDVVYVRMDRTGEHDTHKCPR